MIDRTNFLEPSQKYIERFGDETFEVVKDWFNIDLIHMANTSDKVTEDDKHFHRFVNNFITDMEVPLTLSEIKENYKNFPKESFDKLILELIKKTK